jgi:hypothetical protein
MKAQFLKTFIKAAAIVALATSIANCGAMPEESITESTYQPTSENTDKTTNNDDEEETTNKTPSRSTEPIVDGCEAFGLVFDEANNTCVDDEHEINIINPPETTDEPELPHVDEPGDLGGGNGINPPVEVDEVEALNFTVTPGERRVDVAFSKIEGGTSYTIERVREGSSRVDYIMPLGTNYGFLTLTCYSYSYKLVADMADGSTVETPATDFVIPTNCE